MNTPTRAHRPVGKSVRTPRVRFNWGFHDGANAAARGWLTPWIFGRHPDKSYEAGFEAGRAQQLKGQYVSGTTTSDAAWSVRAAVCEGHPAGTAGVMGQTTYCDGSCRAIRRF